MYFFRSFKKQTLKYELCELSYISYVNNMSYVNKISYVSYMSYIRYMSAFMNRLKSLEIA